MYYAFVRERNSRISQETRRQIPPWSKYEFFASLLEASKTYCHYKAGVAWICLRNSLFLCKEKQTLIIDRNNRWLHVFTRSAITHDSKACKGVLPGVAMQRETIKGGHQRMQSSKRQIYSANSRSRSYHKKVSMHLHFKKSLQSFGELLV